MYLGAVTLKNVQNVNSFQSSTEIRVRQGNSTTCYVQLVDLDQLDSDGKPLRYMPASGSSMTVTLASLNDTNTIVRACAQPFASSDPSVWSFPVLSSDTVNSGNILLTLTEGSAVSTISILQGMRVEAVTNSFC